MKLSIRRTVLGIVAAVSFAFAVPLGTPASAGSCSDLSSIVGSTKTSSYDRLTGSFTIEVSDTLRTHTPGCSSSYWKYTLTLMTVDDVRRGGAAAYGTDASGNSTFRTFTSTSLPKGTEEVAFDHRAYFYNRSTGAWEEQSSRRFVVTVPNVSYDSAAGRNAYALDSCPAQQFPSSGDFSKIIIGYSPWC